MRLKDKVAAITGGAGGIGGATVRRFAAEGARVAFADIDVERGRALEAELTAAGADALFVDARVDEEAGCEAFIAATAERFGALHVLVNNAGIRHYGTVLATTEQTWDAILGVNLKGYAFCAKAAVPVMRDSGGGAIVNLSSIRALVAGGNMIEYDTTKTAVVGLTRALAYDHAPDGIRVNAISPGPVFTEFHARRAAALGKTEEEFKAAFGQGGMQKRPAHPDEIAACILFLASDEASYVTGANLLADGGISALDPDTLTPFLKEG
jgi:NAD(P)-dependent dehydrogenase (short-subunit alcohol dehydrogenase family)